MRREMVVTGYEQGKQGHPQGQQHHQVTVGELGIKTQGQSQTDRPAETAQ